MSWRDLLPKRVPEYNRGDNDLFYYLQTCGQIFDEISDTIKLVDYYKDYKKSPESRLGLIARRYGFDPTITIPESIMRGIIRDINSINKTRGVDASIRWVFKLLQWDITVRYAWLPNPEVYDPAIANAYPNFYLGGNFPAYSTTDDTYEFIIGDPYAIGDVSPTFHLDPQKEFQGPILIGLNDLYDSTNADPITPGLSYTLNTDIGNIDYRNFLYGTVTTKAEGTYFTGGGYFDPEPTVIDARIVGEHYDITKEIRSEFVVSSTPYIVIELSEFTFSNFLQPYDDGSGNLTTYTESEEYATITGLINYLLYEIVKPANVKIMLLVGKTAETENITINDNLQQNLSALDNDIDSNPKLTITNTDTVNYSYVPVMGDGLRMGQPSAHPVNSMASLPYYRMGVDNYSSPYYLSNETFFYNTGDMTFTDNAGTWISDKQYRLRTPSSITINIPGGASVNIEGMIAEGGTWFSVATGVSDGASFDSNDLLYIRLTSAVEPVGAYSASIIWYSQVGATEKPAYLTPA